MFSENIVLFVYLCCIYVEIYKATSKILNSAMNYVTGIKSVLPQTNKILNQTLNIHIQNHLVEGSSLNFRVILILKCVSFFFGPHVQ